MQTPTFNLIDQPWIYCRNLAGATEFLSLRGVFSQAHRLREITDNNPLTVAALHRLLLAIIHRAVDGPASCSAWRALWDRQTLLDSPVFDYLEQQHSRFDLFSEASPFYQSAGFTLESATTSQKLLHELSSGNNKTLFDHHLDDPPAALAPDQAARALLTAQMYAFGGGQGATSHLGKHPNFAHAPLVFGALILVQGDTLFATLLRNLLVYDKKQEPMVSYASDVPLWERSDGRKPGEQSVDGYLDYLTWRSRHIRLLPERENGEIVVRRLYMAQGNMLYKQFHERIPGDPMFAYGVDDEKNRFPIRMDAEKSFWRNSAPLFEFSDDLAKDGRARAFLLAVELINQGLMPEEHLRSLVIGIANDKANPLCWRMEQLIVPSEILRNEALVRRLKQAVDWAETIGDILRKQTRSLAQNVLAPDGRKADAKAVSRLCKSLGVEALYWAGLEAPFHAFLQDLGEAGLLDWRRQVAAGARGVFATTTHQYLSHTAREIQAQAQAVGWLGRQLGAACKELGLYRRQDEPDTAAMAWEDY